MKRVLALLTAGVLATASALDIAQRGKPADCREPDAQDTAGLRFCFQRRRVKGFRIEKLRDEPRRHRPHGIEQIQM